MQYDIKNLKMTFALSPTFKFKKHYLCFASQQHSSASIFPCLEGNTLCLSSILW